uniref:C2H2-type domain-containing protein n=1 Tax=Coccolithus braarudii TaxID=221442 RepID=A0A7S0LRZ1_9EUKA
MNEQTLFQVLPNAQKVETLGSGLRKQRVATQRGEDYEPRRGDLRVFESEKAQAAPVAVKVLKCPHPGCTRVFGEQCDLAKHIHWAHPACSLQSNVLVLPPPPPKPCAVALDMAWSEAAGALSLTILVHGQSLESIKAEQVAAEKAVEERAEALKKEARRREKLREAAAEGDAAAPRRRGSGHRHQYSAKEKLKILEIFDQIYNDASITQKVVTFESSPRAKSTPYSTALRWSNPVTRAAISAAAGREHANSLLRIDKVLVRKKGQFSGMEKDLDGRVVKRRARGLRVSGRWLSATAKSILHKNYAHLPGALTFKAGVWWRRRFSIRFNYVPRKKTNVKNKSWAQSEPVLLRYLGGLRKRLRGADWVQPSPNDEEEPEPEDVNPEREEAESRGEQAILDDEDDADPDDELITFALPAGCSIAPPPTALQLEYKSAVGSELIGRVICFNWAAIGLVRGEDHTREHRWPCQVQGRACQLFRLLRDGRPGRHAPSEGGEL